MTVSLRDYTSKRVFSGKRKLEGEALQKALDRAKKFKLICKELHSKVDGLD